MESITTDRTDSTPRSRSEASSRLRTPLREAAEPGWFERLLRRRHFLIDKRSQLLSVAVVGLFTLALLVPINLSVLVLHTANEAQVATDAPNLVRAIEERNRTAADRILLGSGIILLAAMSVTLFASHRTAGAAVALCRGLGNLRKEKYGSLIALRRGDRLRNVEQALNDLSRSLLERSSSLASELEWEAEALERVPGPPENHAIAQRLREIADRQPRSIGTP